MKHSRLGLKHHAAPQLSSIKLVWPVTRWTQGGAYGELWIAPMLDEVGARVFDGVHDLLYGLGLTDQGRDVEKDLVGSEPSKKMA